MSLSNPSSQRWRRFAGFLILTVALIGCRSPHHVLKWTTRHSLVALPRKHAVHPAPPPPPMLVDPTFYGFEPTWWAPWPESHELMLVEPHPAAETLRTPEADEAGQADMSREATTPETPRDEPLPPGPPGGIGPEPAFPDDAKTEATSPSPATDAPPRRPAATDDQAPPTVFPALPDQSSRPSSRRRAIQVRHRTLHPGFAPVTVLPGPEGEREPLPDYNPADWKRCFPRR